MVREKFNAAAMMGAVVAVGAGMSWVSNKVGFTDALMTYDWATKAIYHEAHEQYPLLFPTSYPNPGTLDNYMDNEFNRVTAHAGAGLIGLLNLGAAGLAVGMEFNERRRKNPNIS